MSSRVNAGSESPLRVVLSCENGREYADLRDVLERMGERRPIDVVVFDVAGLYRDDGPLDTGTWPRVATGRLFRRPVTVQPLWQKIITLSVATLRLRRLLGRHRAQLLVTGVPLVFFRVARLLSPRTRYASFLTRLFGIATPQASTSSRVRWLMVEKLGLTPSRFPLLTDFFADRFFVTGAVDRRFLVGRGVEPEAVHVVGPWWADRVIRSRSGRGPERSAGNTHTILYATSAFAWHGDERLTGAELSHLEALVAEVRRYNASGAVPRLRFVVRVHPYDARARYDHLLGGDVTLDDSGSAVFERYEPATTCLVSSLSGMAYEALYLGFAALFYAPRPIRDTYASFYQIVGAEPAERPADLVADVLRLARGEVPVYSIPLDGVFARTHQCRVAEESARLLLEMAAA